MPDADDASHGEHGQASDERHLRNVIAAGARAAAMPGWAGSSKLAAAIARGAVAQHDLALLLSRKGLHEEADAHLRALGMRFKLSPAILSPSPCDLGPRSKRARLDDGGGIPLVLDNVLPSALHSALKQAFRPGSAFWQDHGYPTPGFFSYRHDLSDHRPPLLAVEQAARLLAPLVEESLVRLHGGHSQRGGGQPSRPAGGGSLRTVEWWAHRRRPGDGHQLHFDLDEVTLLTGGGVHHPLVSAVLYLSGGGGGDTANVDPPSLPPVPPQPPTLVTTQTLHGGSGADAQAARAHLVWPRDGRLLLFRGERLHGVLPGPKAHSPRPPPDEPVPGRRVPGISPPGAGASRRGGANSGTPTVDEDRVTLMFGWWGDGHAPPVPPRRRATRPGAAAQPRLAPCMRLPGPGPPSAPAGSQREADYLRNRWRLVPNWVAEGAAVPGVLAADGAEPPGAWATRGPGVMSPPHIPAEAAGLSNRREKVAEEHRHPMGAAGAVASAGRVWVNVGEGPGPGAPAPHLVGLLGKGSVSFSSLFFLESFDQIEALGRPPPAAAAAPVAPASGPGRGAARRNGLARHGSDGGDDDACEVIDLAGARALADQQRAGRREAPSDSPAGGSGGAQSDESEEEVIDLAGARALAEQQRAGAAALL